MDLKGIMLNEKSQPIKVTYYMTQFIRDFKNDKILEVENRLVVTRD